MVHAASLTHINQPMESSAALAIRQTSVSPSLSLSLSSILSVFALCLCSFLFPRSASLSRTHPSVPGIDYDTVVACISSIGCRRLGISMLISCDVWLNGVVLERIATGTPRRGIRGSVKYCVPKLRVVYLRDSWIVIWCLKCILGFFFSFSFFGFVILG